VNAATRLAAYAAGLAVVAGAAWTAGAAADPLLAPGGEQGHGSMSSATAGPQAVAAGLAVSGLAVSERGYTLRPVTTTAVAGATAPFRFTVSGPDGRPVREYRLSHDKELHLIVVRRDMVGYRHVHPTRDAAGTWSVPLALAAPGTYRVFADFAPAALGGEGLTLGADVFAPGTFAPRPLPAPASVSRVDGYEVTLSGAARAGGTSELTFTVRRAGGPVTGLQPYLGAFGHLVSLRQGDLAYLHTHPGEEAHAGRTGGPDVTFEADFPTAGAYRLFLDFAHGGRVHTAEFTVDVPAAAGSPAPVLPAGETTEHGH
jgi:hypothetical protein